MREAQMARSPKGSASKASITGVQPAGLQPDCAVLRREMVREQIAARGVTAPRVAAAMSEVAREDFVPAELIAFAYEDRPLPIGDGQTISQPYIVAVMIEALKLEGGDKVLEIGTGSGYVAALLSKIAAEVFTVERIEALATAAARRLADHGYANVHVLHADGTRGWSEHAPYDAILVSAGAPEVPRSLKEQLEIGGRLVIPVGDQTHAQELMRLVRVSEHQYQEESLTYVRFVPLVGKEGWDADER
jgi:protein-L-isoaspartate(D-aspartate) O-methyltransferase